MSDRMMFTRIAIVAALGGGILFPSAAPAATNSTCRMKGQWLDNPNDVFEFDARYVYNNGEDDFTGIYDNPGQARATINGAARAGVWNILLTYTDDKHKNMIKKLVGRGSRDRVTGEIVVTGNYKTFLGTNDIKHDGQFRIAGKCK